MTDHARAAERLKLLIDSAIDYAIVGLTPDGHIDSWSAGAERMFGYAAEEIVGRSAALLFTFEDRASNVPMLHLRSAHDTGRAVEERFYLRRDGSRFYASGVTTRLREGPGFVTIARDLSGQRQADETRRVGELLRRIVSTQEDERARIARDLHDELGQQLTALRLVLQRHRDQWAYDGRASIDHALGLIGTMDAAVEFLAWELRPPVLDDLGLRIALPRFVDEWSRRCGVAASFGGSGASPGQLSPEAEVAYYRVAQEALNNVVKHARASRVDVMLKSDQGSVVMVIEDDGVGFDPAERERAGGFGLAGMRQRATLIGATLQIESSPGQGAAVYLRCPLDGEALAGRP